jgi:hypothetical protein
MGKASSSKKVARAARAGGRSSTGPKRQLGYPLAIAAVVIVGILVVLVARNDQQEAAAVAPTVNDHWHAAYGIYVCDTFLPSLTDVEADTTGLHTHNDGVAHLHPFNGAAAGDNATLAKWGEITGLSFSSTGFTVNDTTYEDGYDCGGQPATVSLYVWPADDLEASPRIIPASEMGDFHFDEDRLAITLAVVPEGTEVPPPPSVPELDQLTDVPGATSTTTAVPATSSTTAAPATDPAAESTTTTTAGAQ